MDRCDEANRHLSLLKPVKLKLIYRYIVYKYVWEEIKCVFVLSYLFFYKIFMKACLFYFLLSHIVCCSSVTSNSDSDVVGTPLNNIYIQYVAYQITFVSFLE